MDGHVSADVATLLRESDVAHTAYQRASKAQDYSTAEQHVAAALKARLEAHDLDPDHALPAWRDQSLRTNRVSHDELVRFYRAYPEIP